MLSRRPLNPCAPWCRLVRHSGAAGALFFSVTPPEIQLTGENVLNN